MIRSFRAANARTGARFLENDRSGDEGDQGDRPVAGLEAADEVHGELLLLC
jgi:hypothetical protein